MLGLMLLLLLLMLEEVEEAPGLQQRWHTACKL